MVRTLIDKIPWWNFSCRPPPFHECVFIFPMYFLVLLLLFSAMTFEKSLSQRWKRKLFTLVDQNKYARRIQFRQEWWCLTHNNDHFKSTFLKIAMCSKWKQIVFQHEKDREWKILTECANKTDALSRSTQRLFRWWLIITETNCFYGQCTKLHFQQNRIHHFFFCVVFFGLLVFWGVNRFGSRYLERKNLAKSVLRLHCDDDIHHVVCPLLECVSWNRTI